MDDLALGTRDKRGNWKPSKVLDYPKVFVWPVQPGAILRWIPDYLAPWNFFYAAIGVAFWLWLTPPIETTQHFAPSWVAFIFARNLLLVLAFYGFFHLRLYWQRKARSSNTIASGSTPTTRPSSSALPTWTAYEVVSLRLFANNDIPFVAWADPWSKSSS
jgi:hypothetical protein